MPGASHMQKLHRLSPNISVYSELLTVYSVKGAEPQCHEDTVAWQLVMATSTSTKMATEGSLLWCIKRQFLRKLLDVLI